MYGVNALRFRKGNDPGNIEICFDRTFAFPDRVRLVRLKPMQRQPVLFRMHSDRSQTQLIGRTENAYGNFTAIRRQQFSNGLALGHGQTCASLRSRTFFHAGRLPLQQFFE
jgi:hypothetical protein